MDPFSIASIVAMIASAAMSYDSQQRAQAKARDQALQAQQRQLNMQNEATQVAAKKAAEFDPAQRQQQQQQIEQDLQGQYQQAVSGPQITAQGVQVGATVPDAQAGGDYTAAKAREQAKTTASLRQLAALMGRIGSASELRKREAVGIGDTAGDIGRIQSHADLMGGIDQFGVQQAAQPNIGETVAGEALRAYGMSGGFGRGRAAAKYPEYGASSGPTGGWV